MGTVRQVINVDGAGRSLKVRFKLSNVVTPDRVRSMLNFLDEVDEYPCLYFNRTIISNAVRRFEKLWIPLLASVPESQRLKLVPPLDVEWVWHCYLLCPHAYARDSPRIWASMSSGTIPNYVVDHALLPPHARKLARRKAVEIWNSMYPSEPFDVMSLLKRESISPCLPPIFSASAGSNKTSYISYNIVAAASRQMAFHYQTAVLPHFRSTQFLESAIIRYKKFLWLKTQLPDEIIVPTYDIDAVWHTHMSHPRNYGTVCRKLFGRIFTHDDTMNDRSEGSSLVNQWAVTRHHWRNLLKSPIERSGGMWRGEVSMEERSVRKLIQGAVRVVVSRLSGNRFQIAHDPTNFLCYTTTKSYNLVPWVHTMCLRQALERQNEELHTFAECDDPVVRRLSILKDINDMSSLAACVTSFVDPTMQDMNAVPGQSVVEIFAPWLDIPIASAHIALPGSVIFPENLARSAFTKTVLVLRVGGIDVGLLWGGWVGFRAPSKEAVDNLISRENIQLSSAIYNSLLNGSPGMLRLQLMNVTSGGRGVWETAQWSSKGHLIPKAYSFKTLPRPSTCLGYALDATGRQNPGEGSVSFDLSTGNIYVENEKDALMGYLVSISAAALWVLFQPRYRPSEWRGVESNSAYPRWETTQREYVSLKAACGERTGKGVMEGSAALFLRNLGNDCGLQGNVDDVMRFKASPVNGEAGCGGCGGCFHCGGRGECRECERFADIECYLYNNLRSS